MVEQLKTAMNRSKGHYDVKTWSEVVRPLRPSRAGTLWEQILSAMLSRPRISWFYIPQDFTLYNYRLHFTLYFYVGKNELWLELHDYNIIKKEACLKCRVQSCQECDLNKRYKQPVHNFSETKAFVQTESLTSKTFNLLNILTVLKLSYFIFFEINRLFKFLLLGRDLIVPKGMSDTWAYCAPIMSKIPANFLSFVRSSLL